jgi:hypothetical protein
MLPYKSGSFRHEKPFGDRRAWHGMLISAVRSHAFNSAARLNLRAI